MTAYPSHHIATAMTARSAFLVAPILIALAGPVQAQNNCSCGPGARVAPDTGIASLLGGKTVCASLSASERWQEYHAGTTTAGGDVIDYKKGPAPAEKVDPSKKTGTWSALGTGEGSRVVYNYGSGGTYQYEVCRNGQTIRFCGSRYGGRDITGSLLAGPVSCGF